MADIFAQFKYGPGGGADGTAYYVDVTGSDTTIIAATDELYAHYLLWIAADQDTGALLAFDGDAETSGAPLAAGGALPVSGVQRVSGVKLGSSTVRVNVLKATPTR